MNDPERYFADPDGAEDPALLAPHGIVKPDVPLELRRQEVTFHSDIRPLFRSSDRAAMEHVFDLWSYDDVRSNRDAIARHLRNGTMPCDAAWPSADVDLFERWILEGSLP